MQIGKVLLDESLYDGEDLYSEGDVEEELLEIVKGDIDHDKAIVENPKFAILYHLAKDREMIALPMKISDNDEVLEIGAGCGAVTGALTAKAKSVECIELSKRRSMINAYRHKDDENLTIRVANFKNIEFDKQYDVITLIGVLEYSVYYVGGETPFKDMLDKVKSLLKPGGRLYIAIENRLGLKYFAGAAEDHLGIEFAGIEGYDSDSHVRTFSKNELWKLLSEEGYEDITFLYPFPDYKFPNVILSEGSKPSASDVDKIYSNYGGERITVFDEKKAWGTLVDTDDWKTFANSFLVEAYRR